jgi:hypothetical protein
MGIRLAQRYYAVLFPPVTEEALVVITNYWVFHSVEEAPIKRKGLQTFAILG